MRIQFKYKNHEGKIEDRDVDIVKLGFDMMNHTDYGYQPGWFMAGHDFSRGRNGKVYRSFYFSHIILSDEIKASSYNYILMNLPIETKPENRK